MMYLSGKISYLKSKVGLFQNIIYLGLSQVIGFASPLLVTPYLLRVIGIENFGSVSVAQTVMNFLIVITDYSFNITATQSASINRKDSQFLTRLFHTVTTTKIFLSACGFFFLIFITLIIPSFETNRILFILSYTVVIGRILIPSWLFIGIEKSSMVTFANIVSRSISYSLIFLLVKNQNDFYYVNFLWSVGEIFVGLYCFTILKNKYGIGFKFEFKKNYVITELKNGWKLFLANISTSLYMNSGIVILSLFASKELVGKFSVAEKILVLSKQIYNIVSQATYPYVCRLAVEAKHELRKFLKYEFYSCLVFFSLISFTIYIFAGHLVRFFIGYDDLEAVNILKSLAFVPLIVSLCMPAYQQIAINKFQNTLLAIIVGGAITNIVLSFLTIPGFLVKGAVISILATEIFITLGFHLVLYFKYPSEKIDYI